MDVIARLTSADEPRTTEHLASTIHQLIRSGELAIGTRLPTVRQVAASLHVSPTVVSGAWQLLARTGAIRTEGRRGTFVIGQQAEPAPPRLWQTSLTVGQFAVDLSAGVPDTALLPDLQPALQRLAASATVSNYLEPSVLPGLQHQLTQRWAPLFSPEAVAVVDGAIDAMSRTCREVLVPGDSVVVETPCLPTVYDVVEDLGGKPLAVPMDDQGMIPDALADAIATHHPRMVVIQPRAQNPTGTSLTRARAEQLAEIIAPTRIVVFEDDHCGDVSWAPPVSLAEFIPQQTVVAQSFSKSHGPDLRLAAIGGPLHLVHRLSVRRRLGPSWSSRLLQAVLLDLLSDHTAIECVALARQTYHDRRTALVCALDAHGVGTTGSDGINLWVDVRSEEVARRHLAQAGIGVHIGSPFDFERAAPDHIRITTATVADGFDELAERIATAAA
jgi:DNA-binding transcriptional MocR family regulator